MHLEITYILKNCKTKTQPQSLKKFFVLRGCLFQGSNFTKKKDYFNSMCTETLSPTTLNKYSLINVKNQTSVEANLKTKTGSLLLKFPCN